MKPVQTRARDVGRPSLPAADDCWEAVMTRDRRYDEQFVYAVRTTGIYCRPSCPSRKPRRINVSFHLPADAAAAGYRACLRCRPEGPVGAPADEAVRRAVEYLEANLDVSVPLTRLGDVVGMSPFHLQRTFKDRIGVSPHAYQRARRMEEFRRRAQRGETVGRATYGAGFNSSRSLYEQAQGALGMTPGRYRRGGAGLEISYTTADSPLGRILVAATANGVCAVAIGDDEAQLEAGLRSEFATADLRRDDGRLSAWAEAVVRQAAGEDPGVAVPAELRGTVFQLRVWEALRQIPAGETRTYRQVAEEIGRPDAVRAVANACASNRLALVIPCHRVLRSDGNLGGYRWGIERKRQLLASEADER